MRFFVISSLFGLMIGSVGCVTNNWSSPLFRRGIASSPSKVEQQRDKEDQLNIQQAGIDPRARDIEARLGIDH